jgi:chromosome segregation ATPase
MGVPSSRAEAAPPAPSCDVMITPRVLNQAAFNDLAASLKALIEQASNSAYELRSVLDDLSGARNEASRSSGYLHDRLKVGARMVKAFQTQIDHVEAVLEGLGRQRLEAERTLEEIEERIELAHDRAEALTRLVESAEVNIAVTAHRSAQLASRDAARSEESR